MRRWLYRLLPVVVAALAGGGALLLVLLAVPAARGQWPLLAAGVLGISLAAAALGIGLLRRPPWLPAVLHALDLWRGPNAAYRLREPLIPAALRRALNGVAEHVQEQAEGLDERVASATLHLEQDRELLGALIERMEGAVLACSSDGRVLLYNARLAKVLADEPVIGLGRSIFNVFRRRIVTHFVGLIGPERPSVAGIMASRSGRRYHARFAPLDGGAHGGGFLITLAALDADAPQAGRWHEHLIPFRARFASLKAAVEVLADCPDVPEPRRRRLLEIADSESQALAEGLEAISAATGEAAPLAAEEVVAEDLLPLLAERAGSPTLELVQPAEPLWVLAETWSLGVVVGDFCRQFGGVGRTGWTLSLEPDGERAALRLRWRGERLGAGEFARWYHGVLEEGGGVPAALIEGQDGSMWTTDTDEGGGLVILLAAAAQPSVAVSSRDTPPSRPEYFDFELFRPSAGGDWSQRPLRQLVLTALDTETTGLNPTAGDEIISIGAIRIVNGRVLGQEVFESLIATDAPIHPESQRIHGITPDVLAGQPRAAQVLPRFNEFSGDSVLLGHNIAFDLRFLELAAQRHGLDFAPTALDTLLLSSVVYPQRHVHGLEDIAERLGVAVLGRHTALGDAIVAAEVFVKLLPLLEHKGVRTLGDALTASKESWYARLKY